MRYCYLSLWYNFIPALPASATGAAGGFAVGDGHGNRLLLDLLLFLVQDKDCLLYTSNKVQQAATIENFARAVRSETDIQCSLEEGLRSLQIIHGAYLSHWLERTVPLPPPEDLFRSHLAQLS